MYNEHYLTVQDAFEDLYRIINTNDSRKLHNVGIVIHHPWMNEIGTEYRKWGKGFADKLWHWYLEENKEAGKPEQKRNSMDNLRHNLGVLWREKNQLKKAILQLKQDHNTREAYITFYDGKRKHDYQLSSPRLLSISFTIDNGFLCMSVLERESELWYEWSNDLYAFTELQKLVAGELRLERGWCYYYTSEMSLSDSHHIDVF